MVKVSITLPNNALITLESEEAEVIHEVVSLVLRDLPRDLMSSPTEKNSNDAHPTEDTDKSNGVVAPAAAVREVVTLSEVTQAVPEIAPEILQETAPTLAAGPSDVTPGEAPVVTAAPEDSSLQLAGSSSSTVAEPVPEVVPPETLAPPAELPAAPSAIPTTMAAAPLNPPANTPAATPDIAPLDPVSGNLTEGQGAFVAFCQGINPLGDMRRVVTAAEGAARHLGLASVDAGELGRLFDLAGWPRAHNFTQTLRNAGRSKFRWLERIPGRSGFYRVTELGRVIAEGG